ncbi:MAG TPA: hypothetical protein VFR31_20060 [Thermoanaerobaculia bacterium]|nr:hypothetical protein [Thermoanaerobaculia bacterium]
MAEPMHALHPVSVRRPAATRKPRIPHPHLAPAPHATDSTPPTPAPKVRPAGQARRRSRPAPAERSLRNAILFGFLLNGAALLVPSWQYSSKDFLLAAAILLSGLTLLLLGRRGPA